MHCYSSLTTNNSMTDKKIVYSVWTVQVEQNIHIFIVQRLHFFICKDQTLNIPYQLEKRIEENKQLQVVF
jgi:hypothetical protein